jgi:hypothetical protein
MEEKMTAFYNAEFNLSVPLAKLDVLVEVLQGTTIFEHTEAKPATVDGILAHLFEIWEGLKFEDEGRFLRITGLAAGDMGYGTLAQVLLDALTLVETEGTLDWQEENQGWYRWRFRNGSVSTHESEVTFPTDVDDEGAALVAAVL